MNYNYNYKPGEIYGDNYVLYTNYVQYAASNDLIVLFPQIVNTQENWEGCWDFWGFTGPEFYGN